MCCCMDMSHVLLYGYEPCVVVWIWVMCCCMDMSHVLLYGYEPCVVVWI